MNTGRNAAGVQTSALEGRFPWVAMGRASNGFHIFDDFCRGLELTPDPPTIGDLRWSGTNIRIGASEHQGSFADVAPDSDREIGQARVSTDASSSGATAGDGGTLGWPAALGPLYGQLPTAGFGTVFRTKIRMGSVTNQMTWSGWASAYNTSPRSTNSIDFVGIRAATDVSSGAWQGVVRSGTSETTVDLGGVATDAAWRTAGFRWTADGIQFFNSTVEATTDQDENIGDPIATGLPSGVLRPLPLGLVMLGTILDKTSYIDYFETYGRIAR